MAGRSERGLTLKKRRYSDDETRELTVRDPEGNLWSIGTYAGEPHRG